MQTQLKKRLPVAFTAQFPDGVALAFSAIPVISTLPEPAKSEVRDSFAHSISVIWQVMVGISGIGLLSCLAMKDLPLHNNVDEKWGMEDMSISGANPSETNESAET